LNLVKNNLALSRLFFQSCWIAWGTSTLSSATRRAAFEFDRAHAKEEISCFLAAGQLWSSGFLLW